VVLLGTFTRKRRGSGADQARTQGARVLVGTWATEDDAWRFQSPSFPVRRFGKGH
jgi:hypothetical protein